MSCSKYSDNELHLMSYQELRRLSILLRLPANIKKKYMISMIQAHQKGDGCTKIAIANKIMEERKVKKMNSKGKHGKSYILNSNSSSQQIPTDLSVSTKHEFETRFSYVAHFSSKDSSGAGISRIIKQEAEVSRQNRSIIQQPRKPARKLPGSGRTEIMLPRNHSLTTPVRLKPQYERSFSSTAQYEAISGLASDTHFQVSSSYNYHFPGDCTNSLMASSSHELYRNDPYWRTREAYNNSFMPILSSLLTPNSTSINSSNYATQNAMKGSNSFQGVYEKYIKNGNVMESQTFESCVTNSSAVNVNNHFPDNNNNTFNPSHGGYIMSKNEVDFEINTALNEIRYHQYNRRDDTVIRHVNDNQAFLEDIYLPRNEENSTTPPAIQQVTNNKDFTHCSSQYFRTANPAILPPSYSLPETTGLKNSEMNEVRDYEPEPPLTPLSDYEADPKENEKCWVKQENDIKSPEEKIKVLKNSFRGEFLEGQPTNSLPTVASNLSTNFPEEPDYCNYFPTNGSKENEICVAPNFSRCRFTLGHNKYPETVSVTVNGGLTTLPSFLSTFHANMQRNKAYTICRNSFTGTTETHLNPVMMSSYASQFTSHVSSHVNSSVNGSQIPGQWLYSYSDPHVPCSAESTVYSAWNEYSEDGGNNILTYSNGHEVQIVKCRKHGYHYKYSIANSCE